MGTREGIDPSILERRDRRLALFTKDIDGIKAELEKLVRNIPSMPATTKNMIVDTQLKIAARLESMYHVLVQTEEGHNRVENQSLKLEASQQSRILEMSDQ